MKETLSPDSFIERFPDITSEDPVYIDIGGDSALPVQCRPSPGAKVLTVLFHGAIDRSARSFPSFLWFIDGIEAHSHQISVADPTLTLSDEISNAWFAGSPGTPLQTLLPKFFSKMQQELGIETMIFAGGSGGGFAALYYSATSPGSIAIATLPQTNILTYYSGHRDRFVEGVWGRAVEESRSRPCFDLREVYSIGAQNTVIYIQSMLDTFHVGTQMIPFLSVLGPTASRNVGVYSSYWGRAGHGGSVPHEERERWVRAAIDAETTSVTDVVKSYHLSKPEGTGARTSSSGARSSQRVSDRDVALARKMTDSLIRAGE